MLNQCWRQWWTVMVSLYCSLWGTVSQCRSSCISRDRPRSYFSLLVVTRAGLQLVSDSFRRRSRNRVAVIDPRCNKSMNQCLNWLNVEWSANMSQLTKLEETRLTDAWYKMKCVGYAACVHKSLPLHTASTKGQHTVPSVPAVWWHNCLN